MKNRTQDLCVLVSDLCTRTIAGHRKEISTLVSSAQTNDDLERIVYRIWRSVPLPHDLARRAWLLVIRTFPVLLFLVGCGGPFETPPDSGIDQEPVHAVHKDSGVETRRADSGTGSAHESGADRADLADRMNSDSSPPPVDSSPPPIDTGRETSPPDTGHDTSPPPLDTGCPDLPSTSYYCPDDGVSITYPTQFCAQAESVVGQFPWKTPELCRCAATFNCACIEAANLCDGIGGSFVSCNDSGPVPILLCTGGP